MTDSPDRLTSLLDAVPDTPAPVDALRAAGERSQRRRRSMVTAGVAAAAVVVVAVGSLLVAPEEPTVPPVAVTGTVDLSGSWVVESLVDESGAETVTPDLIGDVTLEFEADRNKVAGDDGCNRMGGTYELAGGRLRVPGLASSEVGCTYDIPLNERLDDVRRAVADGDDAVLLDADGAVVARLSRDPAAGVDLVGSWVVTDVALAMTDLARPPVTLTFDLDPRPPDTVRGEAATGTVAGQTECNSLAAPYLRDGARLAFDPVESTAVGCRDETPLAEVLGDVASLDVAGDDVLLLDEDGERLAMLVREREAPVADAVTGSWDVTALVGADGSSVLPDRSRLRQPVTMEFDPPRAGSRPGDPITFTGHNGCNLIGGAFSASGEDLRIRPSFSELAACPAQAPLFERLREVRHLSFSAEALTLRTADGSVVAVLEPSAP